MEIGSLQTTKIKTHSEGTRRHLQTTFGESSQQKKTSKVKEQLPWKFRLIWVVIRAKRWQFLIVSNDMYILIVWKIFQDKAIKDHIWSRRPRSRSDHPSSFFMHIPRIHTDNLRYVIYYICLATKVRKLRRKVATISDSIKQSKELWTLIRNSTAIRWAKTENNYGMNIQ